MRNRKNVLLKGVIFLLTFVILVLGIISTSGADANHGVPLATYKCDVKNFALKTKIVVSSNGKNVGTISGDIFKLITDPLMLKKDDTIVAYASDDYEFIGQDNHAIVANGEYVFTLKGNFKLFGNSYTLLNKDNEEIAHATFNPFATRGTLYDNDGNIIADYSSFIAFNDYTVRVYTNDYDHDALLLIFASYYSDQNYDKKESN